jgi:platelet-activating factor acetylhydrolase
VVVIAPEHRDGSAPISFVTGTDGTTSRSVDYIHISHKPSPEVHAARSNQLRIRLAELGLVHDLVLGLEGGKAYSNYSKAEDDGDSQSVLKAFTSMLDVSSPGRIAWAGHSFGAASVTQFVKSVYYGVPEDSDADFQPLYNPARNSTLVQQITPDSTLILLDLWAFPLLDEKTKWLRDQDLPCYRGSNPHGSNVLAVLSEAFVKWNANLVQTKMTLSPSRCGLVAEPVHIFYAKTSAHLSQSDFGVLFPWLTRLVLKAQEPERILKLNTRAIIQTMRKNGIEVAETSNADKERPETTKKQKSVSESLSALSGDEDILYKGERIKGWIHLDLQHDSVPEEGVNKKSSEAAQPVDAVIEGEIGA